MFKCLLTDKAHGKEFSIQFEESCVKLEEYVEILADEITERKTLIQLTEISEMFYDEQYREAKIVANVSGHPPFIQYCEYSKV